MLAELGMMGGGISSALENERANTLARKKLLINQPADGTGIISQPNTEIPQQTINQPDGGQYVPPTGLIGSERALIGGFTGATNSINDSTYNAGMQSSAAAQRAEQQIGGGLSSAVNSINSATNASNSQLTNASGIASNAITGGLSGGNVALGAGKQEALNAITGSNADAGARLTEYRQAMNKRPDLNQTVRSFDTSVDAGIKDPLSRAAGNFNGYIASGNDAQKLQSDLYSSDPAVAAAAKQRIINSPALQYQMEEMQRATENSAANRGGLLGANVQLELQRRAQGLAAQDYQNQFNNVTQIANQGIQSSGQVAGLASTEAGIAGNLKQSGIAATAQLEGQKMSGENQRFMQKEDARARIADRLSSLAETAGINKSNIISSTSKDFNANSMNSGQLQSAIATGLGSGLSVNENNRGVNNANTMTRAAEQQAGISTGLGADLSTAERNAGINKAQLYTQTGQQLSSGRTAAGNNIEENINRTSVNLGNMISQQGIDVSESMNKDIGVISGILHDSGLADSMDMKNLATIIANISGGQASNVMQANTDIGNAQANGIMGANNAFQNGVSQVIKLKG